MRVVCTTMLAVASRGTPWMSGGTCRTLRRCCTSLSPPPSALACSRRIVGRYDQAQLLRSALELYLLSPGDSPHRKSLLALAESILGYLPVLTSPAGGFLSAEDADSLPTHDSVKTREGAFYTWTAAEIEEALRVGGVEAEGGGVMKAADVFRWAYGVEEEGNCDPQHDPHGELKRQVSVPSVCDFVRALTVGVERAVPGAYTRRDGSDVWRLC